MTTFIPWNSQPLEEWADKYAKGKFVDLDGRKTHYIEKGSGQPVILIHGFNHDSSTWISNIDALAEQFHVYALDLWGLGFSTREPLDYGFALFAEQLRLFMDHFDIARASIVGHSMGGGTAITFALQNRQRVDRLVLVDAVGVHNPLPLRARFFQLPVVAEFLLGLKTDAIRKKNLADFWIHKKELLTDGYLEEASRCQKVEGTTEAALKILRANFFDTLEDEIRLLGQTDVPVMIVWGREDKVLPLRRGQKMHQLLPGSRFEVIEEAGHLANFDQPEIFNRLAFDFLQNGTG